MKYVIILTIFISISDYTNQDKYYTKRTIIASVINNGKEEEVYRMIEIRGLEIKKLIEKYKFK